MATSGSSSTDVVGVSGDGVLGAPRPGVTVLTGLDGRRRQAIVAAVRALAGDGADPDPVVGRFDLSPVGADRRFDALRVERSLAGQLDPAPLRAALAELRSAPVPGAPVPVPEALHLAEELRRREAAIDRCGPPEVPASPDDLAAAEARLTAARAAFADHEARAGARITQADIEELERAHSAVLDAQEQLDRRFGRAAAEQRFQEAVAEERAVLDRLQVHSYTDFMTGGMRAGRATFGSDELADARHEVMAAERDVEEIRQRIAQTEAHAEAVAEWKRSCAEARALLADDVPGGALRQRLLALRVPAEPVDPSRTLSDALAAVGLEVGTDRSVEDLQAIVEDWLRADDDLQRAQVALELELDQLLHQHPPVPADVRRQLVARLAIQRRRRTAEGDAIPLVLDRALDALADDELHAVLDLVADIAGDVPVLQLTDDPRIVAWERNARATGDTSQERTRRLST